MAQFSIIVPLYGPIASFEDTLASLLRCRPRQAELIAVHHGDYDDPHDLKSEVKFVACSGTHSLIRLWNAAIDKVGGEYVVWVRPGVELDEGWEEDCLAAFDDRQIGCVTPTVILAANQRKVVARGITTDCYGTRRIVSSNDHGEILGPTSFAAVFRQSALGWIDEIDLSWNDIYLDAYLGLALNRLGFRCAVATDWQVTIETEMAIALTTRQSHGLSAARATRRFGEPLSPSTTSAAARDVLLTAQGNWRMRHAFERFGALKFTQADQLYSERLKVLRVQREKLNTPSPQRRVA